VSFKQFFPIPVFIALLATSMMVLDIFKGTTLRHYLPWVSFQAWAMYFLAGCTLKGGARVMLAYFAGAVASVAIFELAGLFQKWGLSEAASYPVAVFPVVIGVICGERVPWFDFVPAWFIGAGVFFGIMGLKQDWPAGTTTTWDKYGTTFAFLMVSCAIGQVYGIVTVFLRTKYQARVKAT